MILVIASCICVSMLTKTDALLMIDDEDQAEVPLRGSWTENRNTDIATENPQA